MSANGPARPDPGARLRLQWSIASALAWGFGLLIVLAVGSVLFFGLRSALRNTMDLTSDKTALIVQSVTERTRLHLAPARSAVEYLAGLVAQGVFDPTEPETLFTHLTISLAAAPQIRSVMFIDTALRAKLVVRGAKGLERMTEDWREYPPAVAGLPRLREATEPQWGEVIHVPEIDGPGTEGTVLNVSMPVRRDGVFLGAFAASVEVRELSEYLSRFASGFGETPFILSGFDRILAHPDFKEGVSGLSAEKPLPLLADIGDPVLALLWDSERSRTSKVAEQVVLPPGMAARVVNADPDSARGPPSHVVVFERISGFGARPWVVGCYFRIDDIGTELIRLKNALLAGLAVLAAAVLAALGVGRLLRRPVQRLATAAERLRNEGPGDLDNLPGSRVKELDSAAHAFNEMAEGLRDRELIRETFGKYVPRSLVTELLADRGVLEPTTRLATVLFTDIVGFSTVSEKLSPRRLIEILNEYFAVVIEPIERNGGVIQQFQGDAILATYNLPVEDSQHASKAVRTALEIQSALAGRRFGTGNGDGGVELATRVGINTGTVVGGTVGAAGRLGYTVHGDDVNLAARIEQLNKQYDSRVLVAQATVELAQADFRFEAIGEVPIRGRSQAARVYLVTG